MLWDPRQTTSIWVLLAPGFPDGREALVAICHDYAEPPPSDDGRPWVQTGSIVIPDLPADPVIWWPTPDVEIYRVDVSTLSPISPDERDEYLASALQHASLRKGRPRWTVSYDGKPI